MLYHQNFPDCSVDNVISPICNVIAAIIVNLSSISGSSSRIGVEAAAAKVMKDKLYRIISHRHIMNANLYHAL